MLTTWKELTWEATIELAGLCKIMAFGFLMSWGVMQAGRRGFTGLANAAQELTTKPRVRKGMEAAVKKVRITFASAANAHQEVPFLCVAELQVLLIKPAS